MRPLTLFVGPNSSGKSSFLQSILLTAQTLQSPARSRAVVLNGALVKLGSFQDIASANDISSPISIAFEVVPRKDSFFSSEGIYDPATHFLKVRRIETRTLQCSYTFSSGQVSESGNQALQLQPFLEQCSLRSTRIREEEDKQEEEYVVLKRSQRALAERLAEYQFSTKELQPAELDALQYEVVELCAAKSPLFTQLSDSYIQDGEPVGAVCWHFLPERTYQVIDRTEETAVLLVDSTIRQIEHPESPHLQIDASAALSPRFQAILLEVFWSFLQAHEHADRETLTHAVQLLERDFSLAHVRTFLQDVRASSPYYADLAQRLQERRPDLLTEARYGQPPTYRIRGERFSDFPTDATDVLREFFTASLKYLGPLREEPRPIYPLAEAPDLRDVGLKGEHTAVVLNVYQNTHIAYIPSAYFASEGDQRQQAKTAPLLEAVQDWLHYMGLADGITPIDRGKLGHEMRVQTQDRDHAYDLIHVGVGVSQILPLLVQALLAEPGSTLILEQPELHLHPRVQTRLADFLLSMIMLEKQCLVETHSEYIINRLRYAAAKTKGGRVAAQVMIYFVEHQEGQSGYRPITINKYGVIEEWPKGFFDETEEMAAEILQAGMIKYKKERGQKH